jgi:Beta-propeller repeat
MRLPGVLNVALMLLSGISAQTNNGQRRLVYGTYLGGRDKECTTGIAVDHAGNAYVVGRTPSPDFPVTTGAFSTTTQVNNNDWTAFVSKINEHGDHLLYSSFLGGNFRSGANAVAVDSSGRAFVVGSTCSSNFPTTPSAILRKPAGTDRVDACDGFLTWLNAAGSQLQYGTFLGGSREDAATAVALSSDGEVVYVGGYTASPDFPITRMAAQAKLNGKTNGFLSAVDVRSGQLLYSTYLGGNGNDRVTAIAVDRDGAVYVSGISDSEKWSNVQLLRFGTLGGTDGFVVKVDPSGKKRPFGIRIGGRSDETLTSVAVDSRGDIYFVGSTVSPDFPVVGANRSQVGRGFIVKVSGRRFAENQTGVIWSRRLGGHGDDAQLSVSAGMPNSVFLSGRSGSKDFPATKGAIYQRLEADNDSTLMRLRASDGQLRFATFIGGTHLHASWYNDEATGVVANANGDVYVTGCTLDVRLPVTSGALQARPNGNSEPFVLRMKFSRSE